MTRARSGLVDGYKICMTQDPAYGRRRPFARLLGVVLVIWLIIGAIAAGQRGYYGSAKSNCASVGTIIVTILAGPLNYVGANPKISCSLPQPSK
jgi:membrane protein YdbS with pleckstrin-like domain